MKTKIVAHAMRAEMANKLSKRMKQTLTLHGFKLYELADLLDIHATTISKWNTGASVPRSYDTYTRIMKEMGDINKQARDKLKAPEQTDLFVPEPEAVRVNPNTYSELYTPPLEVSLGRHTLVGKLREPETTGIAEEDVMERAARMFNELVGRPAMTVKDAHAFLSILEMVRAQ